MIDCRSCNSPSCRGCNIKRLETALKKGYFNNLMDSHNGLVINGPVDEVVYCEDCVASCEIGELEQAVGFRGGKTPPGLIVCRLNYGVVERKHFCSHGALRREDEG